MRKLQCYLSFYLFIYIVLFFFLMSPFLYLIKFKLIALEFGGLQGPVLFPYLLFCVVVTINSKHEVSEECLQGMLATNRG